MHVLTPNIYRTLAEALQTFDYITKTGNFGFLDREVARWSGVTIMVRLCVAGCHMPSGHSSRSPVLQYTLSKTTLKKRHNIGNEREALYAEVRVRCRQPRAPHLTFCTRLASGQPRLGTASSWVAIDPTSQVRLLACARVGPTVSNATRMQTSPSSACFVQSTISTRSRTLWRTQRCSPGAAQTTRPCNACG